MGGNENAASDESVEKRNTAGENCNHSGLQWKKAGVDMQCGGILSLRE